MRLNRLVALTGIFLFFLTCKNKTPAEKYQNELVSVLEEEDHIEFGFNLKDYVVKRDTIRKGDSFGEIMERNKIGYPKIFQIADCTIEKYNGSLITNH